MPGLLFPFESVQTGVTMLTVGLLPSYWSACIYQKLPTTSD